MASELLALCWAATDPLGLARFWAEVLGREPVDEGHDGIALLPGDDTQFPIRFHPTVAEKVGSNRAHFDLTSASAEEQQQTVETALRLGARTSTIGQGEDAEHVVLADPEGNEFCVIELGNGFLAGCGFIGALSCDGLQEVGYFWSEALAWPLGWDQDQETAIQSPRGGAKIAWGGPPVAPQAGRNRMHLDLVPAAGADPHDEVERLVSLGATRPGDASGGGGRVELTDPDGTEFCLVMR